MKTLDMKKRKKTKIADLTKAKAVTINELRGIKKIKTWYRDGSYEITVYDDNGGHKTTRVFKE